MENTLPFLLELNKSAASHRVTFLSMMDEFDIKGKMSGKNLTSSAGKPIDFIGYFIQRLGYNLREENDFCNFHGYREKTHQVAIFALNSKYEGLCREIDRLESTNESIKIFTKDIFSHSPLHPVVEYNTGWYARGPHGGYPIDGRYSTDIPYRPLNY